MNIPFQMGIIILCGVLFGKRLDKTIFENEKQIFTIVFSLLSVFAAMYNVIRQLKSINK
jgi:F0F1-type ATP synthase assembly protein I